MKKIKFLKSMALAAVFTIAMSGTAFASGWTQDANGWKWQLDDGTYLSNAWQWTDGNKDGTAENYYFGSDGYLLTNATTPDQLQVNGDGAWIIDNEVQTKIISLSQGIEPYRKYIGTYHYYMEEYTEDENPPTVNENRDSKLQVVEENGSLYIVTSFSYFIDDKPIIITKRIPLSDHNFTEAVFDAKVGTEYWARYFAFPEENPYGFRGLFVAETFELYEDWYIKE